MMRPQPRGFTLFIALIMTSVILAIGLTLLEVSYKQVTLAAVSKNSISAFYNADAAMECALFWDSKLSFDYFAPVSPQTITCASPHSSPNTFSFTYDNSSGSIHKSNFTIPCPGDTTPGNGLADVEIDKSSAGTTTIYATGYDSCDAHNPRRTSRGIQADY